MRTPSRRGLPRAHADDHVDVFLDTFRMDHDIALLRRLEIEPYTLSLADLLLTKLQIFRLNEKDLRDIVTLLADIEVARADGPGEAAAGSIDSGTIVAGQIDAGYIGRLCADDWGLFYDVTMNLQRVGEAIARFDLSDAQVGAREPGSAAADRRCRRRAQEPALAPAGARRHAQDLAQRARRPGVTRRERV